MDIRHKAVEDMSAVEYKACLAANYGPFEGLMYDALRGCRSRWDTDTGKVIMLWEGPEDKVSSLLAWCLITPITKWGPLGASDWNCKKASVTVQFWVKPKHRKKGYGKMLMDEVQKIDPCPHVFPHSMASAALFVDYNVTASGSTRSWLNRAKNQKKARAA
jgi:hypothetical protein